jgi:sugar-specific transcriptional regulator TrmB
MDNNLNFIISDVYKDIEKINASINDKMLQFITKAGELVELSEDMYQIEKTIKLNKISLKGYVLDSPCCLLLKENNISNYSIDELREYLNKYESSLNKDCSSYYFALSLFELAEEIEKLVDNKIELEINKISELSNKINNIKDVTSNEYQKIYSEIKNDLNNYYLNQKLIDDKSYGICIQMINDIFNFYMSGYPDIPDKYLYGKNID